MCVLTRERERLYIVACVCSVVGVGGRTGAGKVYIEGVCVCVFT